MPLPAQWFGDLVTPKFWGHLWLAEGPATYFENVGGEAAFPGSAFLDRFYADSMTRFLDHDGAAVASHPLATATGAALQKHSTQQTQVHALVHSGNDSRCGLCKESLIKRE